MLVRRLKTSIYPLRRSFSSSFALFRGYSENMNDCELTFFDQSPIDFHLLKQQHEDYQKAILDYGDMIGFEVEPDFAFPDCVFVEDIILPFRLDSDRVLIVLTRPGVESRIGEGVGIQRALEELREKASIKSNEEKLTFESLSPSAKLDGGDVLMIRDEAVVIGIGGRSNYAGAMELGEILVRHGLSNYSIHTVDMTNVPCLHLKSAITVVGENNVELTLLRNEEWLKYSNWGDATHELLRFSRNKFKYINVDESEPEGANALLIPDTKKVIYPSNFKKTTEKMIQAGIDVINVDVTEIQKAEGGVTCCSRFIPNYFGKNNDPDSTDLKYSRKIKYFLGERDDQVLDFRFEPLGNDNFAYVPQSDEFIQAILDASPDMVDSNRVQTANSSRAGSIWLSNDEMQKLREGAEKLAKREPLQYVVGEWDFHDVNLEMQQPIFIPRPETEELVELVLQHFYHHETDQYISSAEDFTILDIGCGSGAISCALGRRIDKCRIISIDKNMEAIKLTKRNIERNNIEDDKIICKQFDITELDVDEFLKSLNISNIDLIVSNPPYIPEEGMKHLEPELSYEDYDALYGGNRDGTAIIYSILEKATRLMKSSYKSSGHIWLEIDETQPNLIENWVKEFNENQDVHDKRLTINQFFNDFQQKPRYCWLSVL